MLCCQPQHFAANVWRRRDGGAAGAGLLLFDIFLQLALRVLIDDLCRFPSLTKQGPGPVGIRGPEDVGNPSLRAGSESLVVKATGISSQADKQGLRIVAPLLHYAFCFGIFGGLRVSGDRFSSRFSRSGRLGRNSRRACADARKGKEGMTNHNYSWMSQTLNTVGVPRITPEV